MWGIGCCCAQPPCGWTTPTGTIDSSTTVSGTMTLAYGSIGLGRTALLANGTGESIITMTGNFTAFQNTFSVTSPTFNLGRPSSGLLWFGICNGIGFQYDWSTRLLYRCILSDDGSVRSTSTSASYAPTTDFTGAPQWIMAWCPTVDCDRVIIAGIRNTGGAPWSACTLMDLAEQPFGMVKLAFGTTISATGGFANTQWSVGTACVSGVCPCVPVTAMQGMVTPTKVITGFPASLSFNPGSPPGTVGLTQSNPFANLTPNAGFLTSPRMIDPNGYDYCYGCTWGGTYPQANVSASNGTCLAAMPASPVPTERVGATLQLPSAAINTPTSLGYCMDVPGTLGAGWKLSVLFEWLQGDNARGGIISYTVLAIYQGSMNANFTAATFTLNQVGHLYFSSFSGAFGCSSTCGAYNWIDPSSWPTTVHLAWIPTNAPTCVTSGGGGGGIHGSTNWTAVSAGPLAGVGSAALIWQQTSSTCTGAFLPTEPSFCPPSLGATTTTFCA